mgnify:FL=1
MATSAKKIPSLIGEAVETGVDIIKGTKRQPLETVDYTQTTWLDDLQGARKDKSVTKADDTKPLSSLDKSVQSMLNYKVNTPYGTGNPPSGRKKWITKIASGKDDLLLRAKIKDTHFKEFSKDSSLNDLITRIADMKKWGEDFNFGVRLEGENIRGRKGYWNSYPGYDLSLIHI